MNINDPIGDMITRIRNAHLRGKDSVESPSSNLRINVLEVLKDEGFIGVFQQRVMIMGNQKYKLI